MTANVPVTSFIDCFYAYGLGYQWKNKYAPAGLREKSTPVRKWSLENKDFLCVLGLQQTTNQRVTVAVL